LPILKIGISFPGAGNVEQGTSTMPYTYSEMTETQKYELTTPIKEKNNPSGTDNKDTISTYSANSQTNNISLISSGEFKLIYLIR